MENLIFSPIQTQVLLQARQDGLKSVRVSPDLGISSVDAVVEPGGVQFSNGQFISWGIIEEITDAKNNCFSVQDGQAHKIIAYSEMTSRVYSLMPTQRAPTMLVSGIPMHRIKGTDPYADTLEKIKTLKPVVGEVLDTTTGLGYTAIQAAKTADHVLTVELDPAALEIAHSNPWSRALFTDSKIEQVIADSYELVNNLECDRFSRIVHDPPAFGLAGQLYAGDFYVQLFRLLKPGGRLFHYIGNPKSKSGASLTRGVKQRLQAAGFKRVMARREAFGVLAFK